MVNYQIYFSKKANKDKKLIKQAGLEKKARELLKVLEKDPYQNPPPYEKLVGNLSGYFSRRINIQHRLVYKIYEEEKAVQIVRMWTHYE
jgi:Txe/YoeB family toxin of toxin-antitoxin system